jgi:hypothetical protein
MEGRGVAMAITVSGERVIEVLREVVAERPDYVYAAPPEMITTAMLANPCFYVHGEGADAVPGCVVGAVLNRLGVPLSELAGYEGTPAQHVAERLLETDHDVVSMLREVQTEQDQGTSWGDALAHWDPEL